MKAFDQKPLTPQTLAKRLHEYNFWSRSSLDPVIAKNALLAAKKVCRETGKHKSNLHGTRRILSHIDHAQLLNKMYLFVPLQAHITHLWREVFLVEPTPSFKLKEQILTKTLKPLSGNTVKPIIEAVVRSELAMGNFHNSLSLLQLIPPRPLASIITLPSIQLGLATSSLALWASAPLIGVSLFTFWVGLAVNALRLPTFSRVRWSPWSSQSRLTQLIHTDRLKMAEAIMTAFEENKSINITNYHRKALTISSNSEEERQLIAALRKQGIDIIYEYPPSDKYADYWSENNLRWNSVEWHEPDQDPAEILSEQRETTK